MTSFYNKYNLNNSDNPRDIDVLKKKYTVNYNDYEKLKVSEQYNKLYENVYGENKKNVEINENKKIYNLTLSNLITNSISVYVSLLNDLSIYFYKENKKDLNKLGYILTKNDNLLYIGILILAISFLLWLINITK